MTDYLIYSIEHQAWWMTGKHSYTTDFDQAGTFTRDNAIKTSALARDGIGTGITEIPIRLDDIAEAFALFHMTSSLCKPLVHPTNCYNCNDSGRIFDCDKWPQCGCAEGTTKKNCPGKSTPCPICQNPIADDQGNARLELVKRIEITVQQDYPKTPRDQVELVEDCIQAICEELELDPGEGLLLLLTAACHINLIHCTPKELIHKQGSWMDARLQMALKDTQNLFPDDFHNKTGAQDGSE